LLRKFGNHLAGYNTVHNPYDRSFSLLKISLFSEFATVPDPTDVSNPRFAATARIVSFQGTWLHLVLSVCKHHIRGTFFFVVQTNGVALCPGSECVYSL